MEIKQILYRQQRTEWYYISAASSRLPTGLLRPIPNLNVFFEEAPTVVEDTKLRAFPSRDEIWNVIKELPNAKAPDIDGLFAEVVKHHWSVMKDDISAAILYFFTTRRMLRSLNLATLTLIPKIRLPERLEDYRLISCLGVIYKIFSKILSTRLTSVLLGIMSANQTAFIKGHQISDACNWPCARVHSGFQLLKHIEKSMCHQRFRQSL